MALQSRRQYQLEIGQIHRLTSFENRNASCWISLISTNYHDFMTCMNAKDTPRDFLSGHEQRKDVDWVLQSPDRLQRWVSQVLGLQHVHVLQIFPARQSVNKTLIRSIQYQPLRKIISALFSSTFYIFFYFLKYANSINSMNGYFTYFLY